MADTQSFEALVSPVQPPSLQALPIFEQGPPRWYALRVAPQKEDQVEAWLRARGVYAFHPVLHRRSRLRGATKTYFKRYLPGIVFARFKGLPHVDRVMSCPWITGAICRSDKVWGVLEPSGLVGLYRMRKVDVEARLADAAKRARARADKKMAQGDRAMFAAGPFAGFECEIISLVAEGGISVSFHILGKENTLTIDEASLIKR